MFGQELAVASAAGVGGRDHPTSEGGVGVLLALNEIDRFTGVDRRHDLGQPVEQWAESAERPPPGVGVPALRAEVLRVVAQHSTDSLACGVGVLVGLDQSTEAGLGFLGRPGVWGWVGGRCGGLAVSEVDQAVAAASAPAFRRGWVIEKVANREARGCQHGGVVATGKA